MNLGEPCRLNADLERAAGADRAAVDEDRLPFLFQMLLVVMAVRPI